MGFIDGHDQYRYISYVVFSMRANSRFFCFYFLLMAGGRGSGGMNAACAYMRIVISFFGYFGREGEGKREAEILSQGHGDISKSSDHVFRSSVLHFDGCNTNQLREPVILEQLSDYSYLYAHTLSITKHITILKQRLRAGRRREVHSAQRSCLSTISLRLYAPLLPALEMKTYHKRLP
ncbi:hypothetical protein EDC01DRAFT_28830 [Geopyxis carbonaria]|nr:hypothetical protein EDC01DRAFT_28830 [Geopyxis carbonaria]